MRHILVWDYFESVKHFIRTGRYYRSSGLIDYRATVGAWWFDSSAATLSRSLYTGQSEALLQNSYGHGFGFAVRCVIREG